MKKNATLVLMISSGLRQSVGRIDLQDSRDRRPIGLFPLKKPATSPSKTPFYGLYLFIWVAQKGVGVMAGEKSGIFEKIKGVIKEKRDQVRKPKGIELDAPLLKLNLKKKAKKKKSKRCHVRGKVEWRELVVVRMQKEWL